MPICAKIRSRDKKTLNYLKEAQWFSKYQTSKLRKYEDWMRLAKPAQITQNQYINLNKRIKIQIKIYFIGYLFTSDKCFHVFSHTNVIFSDCQVNDDNI